MFGPGPFDKSKLEKINDAFKFLETFLSSTPFAAGDNLTLADLALVATVSSYDVCGYDLSPYKNVSTWYTKVKESAPGYEEANGKNVLLFKGMFESMTKGK